MSRAKSPVVFCAFCAQQNHGLCTDISLSGPCACGARDHDPPVEVAAAMLVYACPDITGGSMAERAARWRSYGEQTR